MLKIKTQTDYFLTEVTFEAPVDLAEVQQMIKRTHSNSKITAIFNEGGVIGVNIEQKKRVKADQSANIREMLGVKSEII